LLICCRELFTLRDVCNCGAVVPQDICTIFNLPSQHGISHHFALFRSYIHGSLKQLKHVITTEELESIRQHWILHDRLGEYLDTKPYTIKTHLERAHSRLNSNLSSHLIIDISIHRGSSVGNTWCFTAEKGHLDAKKCLTNNKDDSSQRAHHVHLLWSLELDHTNDISLNSMVVK
jgi:hypothetical protein